MNIIGLQAFFHSHATALLYNGDLRFFIEEEKINRVKAERDGFPIESFKLALILDSLGGGVGGLGC